MRVFVVNGAPRPTGFTRDLLALLCNGVTSAGGEVDLVHLNEVKILPCTGCYDCWDPKTPGECPLHDDMDSLTARYFASDAVVFATPLYFYSFSSSLHAFFERLLPLNVPVIATGSTLGLMRNGPRYPDRGPRRAVLVAVAGHRGTQILDGLVTNFELVCDTLDLKPVGKLLRPESFFLDFPTLMPFTVRKVRAAFESAGRELVSTGVVSEKTERQASAQLTRSQDVFRHHFATYWEIAGKRKDFAANRDTLKDAVLRDLNVLMPELATRFDPVVGKDVEAVFLFEVTGAQAGCWTLDVSGGACRVTAKRHPSPSVAIRASSDTLIGIIWQEIDPRRAISTGALEITGDLGLFARFARLFPPSSG